MVNIGHRIITKLKGEERYLSIPYINLHFSKKGLVYNGAVTGFSALIGKLTNVSVFIALLIVLNAIAYPLAHGKVSRKKFEGGNLPYDRYFLRMFKFKKHGGNIYIRKRGIQ